MKTIFILDENSDKRNQMTHHLTAMGFDVCSFASIDFVAVNEKPFTVILDEKFNFGGKNGIQVIKKIRKKLSNAPVLFMRNRIDSKSSSEARKAGAYVVIEKNSAQFVNLRTALDQLVSDPPKMNWFMRLFSKKQVQSLPALSV
ncbi:MAG TPA: response regulator [Cyclobacteriaceae bacterium]|nr:response regulator [Cyclobacteriaceae bacterium]